MIIIKYFKKIILIVLLSTTSVYSKSYSDTVKLSMKNIIQTQELEQNLISSLVNRNFNYCLNNLSDTINVVIINGGKVILNSEMIKDTTVAMITNTLNKLPYGNIKLIAASSETKHGYIAELKTNDDIIYYVYFIIDKLKIVAILLK